MKQPRKDLFHMYSKSFHLPQFQQSAGAIHLWSLCPDPKHPPPPRQLPCYTHKPSNLHLGLTSCKALRSLCPASSHDSWRPRSASGKGFSKAAYIQSWLKNPALPDLSIKYRIPMLTWSGIGVGGGGGGLRHATNPITGTRKAKVEFKRGCTDKVINGRFFLKETPGG